VRSSEEIAALAAVLLKRVPELAAAMAAAVQAEVHDYDSRAVPPEDLRESCRVQLDTAFRSMAGESALDVEATGIVGRRRAEQNVPLATVLAGYRVGTRFLWKTVVEQARATGLAGGDALVGAASDIWEIQDQITDGMVAGYRDAVTERLRASDQERSALVEALLQGRSIDAAELWAAADILRVPRNGPFAVVAAEVPEAGRRALPEAEATLHRLGIYSAWRLRPDVQIGVAYLRPPRQFDELVGVLSRQARDRVGVSPPYDDLGRTGDALRFARVAMAAGRAGGAAVTVFDAAGVAVAAAAAPDVTRRVAATVLGPLDALSAAERTTLLDTLDVWIASGGSTDETARRMYCHPNTVRLRLRRLTERTGRSLTDPVGITELTLALRARQQEPRPDPPRA
jgi:PucR C-terminal helix-turn-helix domain/GGDEF-like domain